MLASQPHVVACFEAEWNSPGMNKSRSFNILEDPAAANPRFLLPRSCLQVRIRGRGLAMASKIFMISGGRFCDRPLKKQEIEFRRLADQTSQHGVYLSPVMGLVIEPMRQGGRQLLLELFR